MPNIGPTELVLVILILLIIFGPGKLAGLGSSLGKSIREFRNATQEPEEEETVEREVTEVRKVDGKVVEEKVVEEERREIKRPTITFEEETETVAPADEPETRSRTV
jgi:sec-independent protein translocase protein TatA